MRVRTSLAILALGLTVVLAPAGADAGTITVCWDGSGDHTTIQAGINAAVDGQDEVVVCPGTYTGPGNRDLDFGGKAITVRSTDGARSWQAEEKETLLLLIGHQMEGSAFFS